MKLNNNKYHIGKINILELSNNYGSPLYVYNGHKIEEQYDKIVSAFNQCPLKVKYACKALTNINILRLLQRKGAGLDAVSIQEVQLGLKAGFKAENIIFTPNSVSFQEIVDATELGVQINVDNISMLEQFGNKYGNTKGCCIRINPHILAGGHSIIQTGHIDSKFGISIHQLRHVLRIVNKYNMRINGLHMHTGSDILDPTVFLRGMEILFDVAREFDDLEFIDFGSGFKVAYSPTDITTNLDELGKKVCERFNSFCKEYGKNLVLSFEPGKYLVSEAGVLLVNVNVIKYTTSTVFAGVNSGQNHLIRPMLYDAHHEIINISNPSGTQRIYSVVGYICETDTFGWDRQISEIREGDTLAILNAGAYGFMMSSNYNSRFRPAEVLIYNDEAHLIRERETIEDLLYKQVEIDLFK